MRGFCVEFGIYICICTIGFNVNRWQASHFMPFLRTSSLRMHFYWFYVLLLQRWNFFLFIIRSFVCSSIIFSLNLAIPGKFIVSLLHFSPKFTCFISWDQFSLVSTSSEMINFQKRVKTPHNWIAHSNQQEGITVPFLVRSCVRLLIFCCWFFLCIYFRCCWFSWFPFALLHILSVF